jgi:hypothetical protein
MRTLLTFLLGTLFGAVILAWLGGRTVLKELHGELTKVAPQLDQTLLNMERVLESTRGELAPYVEESQGEESGVAQSDQ